MYFHSISGFLFYKITFSAFYNFISPLFLLYLFPRMSSHLGTRMEEEMLALICTRTWPLVLCLFRKYMVGCRWVFMVEAGLDGFLGMLKVCLVAKGYTSLRGRLFKAFFFQLPRCPQSDFSCLLQLLSPSLVSIGCEEFVFLIGNLMEGVYMGQPPGLFLRGSLIWGPCYTNHCIV